VHLENPCRALSSSSSSNSTSSSTTKSRRYFDSQINNSVRIRNTRLLLKIIESRSKNGSAEFIAGKFRVQNRETSGTQLSGKRVAASIRATSKTYVLTHEMFLSRSYSFRKVIWKTEILTKIAPNRKIQLNIQAKHASIITTRACHNPSHHRIVAIITPSSWNNESSVSFDWERFRPSQYQIRSHQTRRRSQAA